MAAKTTTPPETAKGPRLERAGPFYLLVIVGLSVFLGQALVMALLTLLHLPHLTEMVLDSSLLILFISPALYLFVFRPIQRQIAQRKQVEAELQQARVELEERVASRTHQLEQANKALQEEISERKKAEGELRLAFEYASQRQAEIEALLHGTRAVLEYRDFQKASQEIFSTCKSLVGASQGYVLLLNREAKEGSFVLVELDDQNPSPGFEPLHPIFGIQDLVFQTGKTIYENQAQEIRFGLNMPEIHPPLENILIAPMTIHGNVIGLIGLANKPGGFTENDDHMASAFGEIAAIALMNSLAESELRTAHDELEARVQERTQELEDAVYDLREENIERKRAEAQSQLQVAALEAAANGIVITDVHGRVQWCNPAFTEMTGYSLEEILGMSTSILKSGQQPAEFYEDLWMTILNSQVWQGELINRRKDGSLYTEEQTITPVLDEKGKTTHFIAIKQDITERRMVAEALEMERRRLFSLLDELPANVLLLAPDHSINFANRQFRERFGDTQTKDCYECMHNRLFPCQDCPPFEVFKTRQPVEWEQVWPDGMSYQIYNYPFYDVNGDLLVLYLGIDITARKQAERMLESSNQELRALSVREHNQRLLAEGLAESAIALNTSLDLNAVFDRILEGIQDVVPCRAAVIYLLQGGEITVARRRGFKDHPDAPNPPEDKHPLADFPVYKQIADSLRPVLVPDTRTYPDWRSLPGMEWLISFAAVPLIGREGMIGVLGLLSDEPSFFGEEIIGRLQAFAAQAVVAIQNARSYEAEQRARRTAETLREASIALTRSLDLDTVLGALLDYLVRLVPYDVAAVMMLVDETHLAVRVLRGAENYPEMSNSASIVIDPTSTNTTNAILLEGRSVIIQETLEIPNWPTMFGLDRIRSWIGVPLVAGERVIGLCGLGKMSPNFFTEEYVRWAELFSSQSTIAIQNAWLFEQVRAGRERLQSLSHRLVEIQEAERLYVARELHDEAGQALASLMVSLRLLERDASQPEAVVAGLGELKNVVQGVLENLHRLAMDLRPASLDHLGLVPALRQYVETVGDKHDLLLEFETVGLGDDRLPVDIETALYRIVQEALANVVRHSGASRADVLLESRGDCLVLVIEDNGVGFDVDAKMLSNRLGLYGMRERAEMLGGQLVIESTLGVGTTIFVEVPYVRIDTAGKAG